ncbi:cysteine-rich DPF motif domain-containing protein 1 isoform X2 [Talpa occidentalis]|uniref:cysteine-rich DPF motif domain-containing protein 1 isoform X2 n=1 Tax=Talpa occidentalis TaxID=50954 RepID=UPI0023F83E36|nr:cysteine-rich DPF motif domain-containing protein 1 isoform X2 [Talpa occidentalis]
MRGAQGRARRTPESEERKETSQFRVQTRTSQNQPRGHVGLSRGELEINMAWDAASRPLGVFECQLCALTAPYSYMGQKPPNTQCVLLLEESYVTKDPFTPDKDRFLVLGSRCSVCGRLVCVGPECSLFYAKRFCLPCVRENIGAFPWEIRQDLEKRKFPSKRPASQPGSRT